MPGKMEFTLNGQPVSLEVDGERTLLWVLRTELGLTGPKYGCGEGHCGACTVLVDNVAQQSCQMSVAEVQGSEVVTIEGLARDGVLHPVQQSFIDHDAMQCGFCTPGMILKAYSLLQENPSPSRDDIYQAMHDNLCRCGAHVRIVHAIADAADRLKGGS